MCLLAVNFCAGNSESWRFSSWIIRIGVFACRRCTEDSAGRVTGISSPPLGRRSSRTTHRNGSPPPPPGKWSRNGSPAAGVFRARRVDRAEILSCPGPAGREAMGQDDGATSMSTFPIMPCSTASCAAAVASSGKRLSGRPCSSPTRNAPSFSASETAATACCFCSSVTV